MSVGHRNRNDPIYIPANCHLLNFLYILIRENHNIISLFSQKPLQVSQYIPIKWCLISRASGKLRRCNKNTDNSGTPVGQCIQPQSWNIIIFCQKPFYLLYGFSRNSGIFFVKNIGNCSRAYPCLSGNLFYRNHKKPPILWVKYNTLCHRIARVNLYIGCQQRTIKV